MAVVEHLKTHRWTSEQLRCILLLYESGPLLITRNMLRPINLHCAVEWLMSGGRGADWGSVE
jgi:hypothetical protein